MRAFPQQGIKSGWNRRRLGHLIQFRNGKDTKSVEAADGAYPVYGSGGEFKRADAYLYDGPSILFEFFLAVRAPWTSRCSCTENSGLWTRCSTRFQVQR